MAMFVWLEGNQDALNMDHVARVEPSTGADGVTIAIAVQMADGRTTVLGGDPARRVLAWLKDNADWPTLSPAGGQG